MTKSGGSNSKFLKCTFHVDIGETSKQFSTETKRIFIDKGCCGKQMYTRNVSSQIDVHGHDERIAGISKASTPTV